MSSLSTSFVRRPGLHPRASVLVLPMIFRTPAGKPHRVHSPGQRALLQQKALRGPLSGSHKSDSLSDRPFGDFRNSLSVLSILPFLTFCRLLQVLSRTSITMGIPPPAANRNIRTTELKANQDWEKTRFRQQAHALSYCSTVFCERHCLATGISPFGAGQRAQRLIAECFFPRRVPGSETGLC